MKPESIELLAGLYLSLPSCPFSPIHVLVPLESSRPLLRSEAT